MTLECPSEILLCEEWFGLLDFGLVMIVVTADPDIKTSGLDCVFAACHIYDGSSYLEERNRAQNGTYGC